MSGRTPPAPATTSEMYLAAILDMLNAIEQRLAALQVLQGGAPKVGEGEVELREPELYSTTNSEVEYCFLQKAR